ncbi:hypothetical protein SLS53_006623 [Cytospora paraplurivora]|uniref:Beta-lactamase-related domain-containing protein n=1 Tax=Cytospora paraplurivora TaxID=2898453 RepID=A0AAN9U4T3_9PEZI
MEEAFKVACAEKTIPGAVLISGDVSGKFHYANTFGVRSLKEPLSKEPLTPESTMWIASCTKLLTSIAAMQCVERGLVTLDQDVRPILHELQDIDILQGDREDTVLSIRKNSTPITLSWSYGPSTDWAGVLVERITGSNLQDYMARNIWETLGITDMTFFLSQRPDLQSRLAHMAWRDSSEIPAEQDRPVDYAFVQPVLKPDMEDCQGGGGIFSSPAEYFKVLHALLVAGSDSAPSHPQGGQWDKPAQEQLLRRSSVDAMFAPQLGDGARDALQALSKVPRLNRMMGGMPPSARRDWGLGGLLVLDDVPGWRGKGTMAWGGTPNLTWWIDRKAGLCGLYAGQVMPIGDAKCVELNKLFEREMYARYRKSAGLE